MTRLVTYSAKGAKSIGIELDEGILDLPQLSLHLKEEESLLGGAFPLEMKELLSIDQSLETVRDMMYAYVALPEKDRPALLSHKAIRLHAPIERPGKIVALGLNYHDHIEETGRDVPSFPVIFAKFPSSVVGPDDPIPMPRVSRKLDWEIELGVIIGKRCKHASKDEALDYVAGYTILNDVSARDLQDDDDQWIRAKSLDAFCPMGPALVTCDELGDGSRLDLWTKVNGEMKQSSNTSSLLYGVTDIVEYLSTSFTLEPGDVIATGTPSGVGDARVPPEYLQPGDEIELFVEGIGHLCNRVVG
ncbi:FAA hydrolase family protein [Candidatus Thorarchaeota archaeon]|nr:MAG: FAA hydrolase family protein [Candidatus Thorarchaeota archaeon]